MNSAFTDESDVLAKDESSLLKAFSPADDVTYTKKTNDGSELTISKSKPKSDLLDTSRRIPRWQTSNHLRARRNGRMT